MSALSDIETTLGQQYRRHKGLAVVHYAGALSLYPLVGAALAQAAGAAGASMAGISWGHYYALEAGTAGARREAVRRVSSVLHQLDGAKTPATRQAVLQRELGIDGREEKEDWLSLEEAIVHTKKLLSETGLRAPSDLATYHRLLDMQQSVALLEREFSHEGREGV